MSSTPAMRRLSREPMAAAGRAAGPEDAERRQQRRRGVRWESESVRAATTAPVRHRSGTYHQRRGVVAEASTAAYRASRRQRALSHGSRS